MKDKNADSLNAYVQFWSPWEILTKLQSSIH